MSVHYKFKSALEYDTVTFDGLHISVKDLKNAIIQQKRIGKTSDFDLQVTNAQTKEVYEDENALIPKNTSLLIARIPNAAQTKSKQWEGYGGDNTPPTKIDEVGPIAKATDLSSLDAPEDDKIKAMISQSTQDYDPSNYMKIRGANQVGAVPPNYRCYKCHQTGHWIKDCPLSKGPEPIEIKKSTGIPLSFMVPVEGPQVQGAMMTPNGSYAVPVLDHQTYTQKQTAPVQPIIEAKPEIPEDLLCSICSDLLTDAVMIPCCGNSFCDECIRSNLLDSEEHECPDCHEKDISPATLIPNRFLRNSVANFKNTTGYVKKPTYKAKSHIKKIEEIETIDGGKIEEKTVISEADSTEHTKTELKEEDEKTSPKPEPSDTIPEGPPGVSPEESPKTQPISKQITHDSRRSTRRASREESPSRRHHHRRGSPFRDLSRSDERSATPTVDEPGAHHHHIYPPPYNAPPPIPPPNMPYTNPPAPMAYAPPTNGPPPNFRLPPPGAPYIAPGSYPPYDGGRGPPLQAPPPQIYQTGSGYQGRSHHHRDYGMGGDRRMRGRTPSGRRYRVIDDPLAAFNRMLREKDERERRAKQRQQRRSYSRSRSRSRSYSRSPRRMRSRSPLAPSSRRRSRSRSFSISRSRSRSFSGSPFRDFSPHSRRKGPTRYRSPPLRSPPRHRYKEYKESFRENRDFHHHRGYSRERNEHRGRDERHEYPYFESGYDDRRGGAKGSGWGQQNRNVAPPPVVTQAPSADAYYPQEIQAYAAAAPNRYPQRVDYQPYGGPPKDIMRRYEDVAPPGVEEPPVPGLENTRFEERFDRFPSPKREEPKKENKEKKRTPERKKSPDRKRSKSKDKETPEKHKKRKRDPSPEKKIISDEEKNKKTKERKKKKEKKDSEKKKRKDKKEKHKDKKHSKEEFKEILSSSSPPPPKKEEPIEESKGELYDDVPNEEIDTKIMENYEKAKEEIETQKEPELEQPQIQEESKDFEEEEKDILEIHTSELDLKSENEMLAQLPEKSKWEVEEDGTSQTSPKTDKSESKIDKAGGAKVTNEVLKRAENAIFAKAINAIRPMEIKKRSYDGDEESGGVAEEKSDNPSQRKRVEAPLSLNNQAPTRVSIKERLGVKVDEPEVNRNKSRSMSPFSRRVNETNRNYGLGERRVELMDRRRRDRSRHRDRGSSTRRGDYRREKRSPTKRRDEKRRERSRSKPKQDEARKERKKRSCSKSEEEKKRREKRAKKEKSKSKEKEKKEEIDKKLEEILQKRKPTIDEAHFEPDYDLESESEKKSEEKKSSSSSDSSESSSDDERSRKRKHKKHRKKKSKKESSSSSSDSESESSDDEKDKRKKKHKRKQKKKKKSKHK